DLLEQRDPAVAGVTERRGVAVGDDAGGERVPVDGRAALLGERLEQAGQGDRVGADVADRERRAEAELEAGQLQQRGERGDGERDNYLGAGRAQGGDLRGHVDVGRHVALPADHHRLRDLVVEALDAVHAEL